MRLGDRDSSPHSEAYSKRGSSFSCFLAGGGPHASVSRDRPHRHETCTKRKLRNETYERKPTKRELGDRYRVCARSLAWQFAVRPSVTVHTATIFLSHSFANLQRVQMSFCFFELHIAGNEKIQKKTFQSFLNMFFKYQTFRSLDIYRPLSPFSGIIRCVEHVFLRFICTRTSR